MHQGLSAWSCFSQVLGSTCSTTPYHPLRSWFHSDFTKKTEVTSLNFLTVSSLSPPNSAQKYFPLPHSSSWALSFSFKASGKYQDFPRNLLMHNKCSKNVSYYYFYLMILHTESITVLCARTILFVLYCTDHTLMISYMPFPFMIPQAPWEQGMCLVHLGKQYSAWYITDAQ